MSTREEEHKKAQALLRLKQRQEITDGLPHLWGMKHYKWSRAFFESRNKYNLLCASNQIGKSSVQIRKAIHWATEDTLWPQLWRKKPLQFWYLYPTKDVATIEVDKKWIPEWLPRGKFKEHPKYGWDIEKKGANHVFAIHFKSGVSLYFKTYETDVQNLQTGSADAIFCFTPETKVLTQNGLKKISSISDGEMVITHVGARKSRKTAPRTASTTRRLLSNGEYIDATPDHKFMVNGSWVSLLDLTTEELPSSQETWANWEKERALYLRDTFTRAIQSLATGVIATSKIIPARFQGTYIQQFGKRLLDLFLREKLFITLTRIQRTMRLITWSALLAASTIRFTKKSNGPMGRLVFQSKKLAYSVANRLSLALHRRPLQDFVLRNAESGATPSLFLAPNVGTRSEDERTQGRTFAREYARSIIEERSFTQSFLAVFGAIKKFLILALDSRQSVYALPGALTLGEQTVQCLNVEEAHHFYVGGLTAKNCDEELVDFLFDELNMRIAATDGYFHMVFTATLGQEFWREAIELKGTHERFKDAFKLQVSMYDCLKYEDGSPSHWTREKISRLKMTCRSENEVKRRIYGRFVKDDGLKYPGFDRAKNVIAPVPVPKDWVVFAGIDPGGGGKGHPAAIAFVACSPDFKKGYVFKGWRGDKEVTTSADVLRKYVEMRDEDGLKVAVAYYDWANKDLVTIAQRVGVPLVAAEKGHEKGEQVLNVLFKAHMLDIFDTPELQPLMSELESLNANAKKQKAQDDLIDATRYASVSLPWDFSAIEGFLRQAPKKGAINDHVRDRKTLAMGGNGYVDPSIGSSIESEIEEWANLYEP